jgi:hypothetical protein
MRRPAAECKAPQPPAGMSGKGVGLGARPVPGCGKVCPKKAHSASPFEGFGRTPLLLYESP